MNKDNLRFYDASIACNGSVRELQVWISLSSVPPVADAACWNIAAANRVLPASAENVRRARTTKPSEESEN